MAKGKAATIQIVEIRRGEAEFCILGETPLFPRQFSTKALQELLLGGGGRNMADRRSTVKHNPLEEYRESAPMDRSPDGPTRIYIYAQSFKKAMCDTVLRPGMGADVAKSDIQSLVRVEPRNVAVYGKPYLHMAVVRNAGFRAAPDIRTRAILPRWACRLTVNYVEPALTAEAVTTLMVNAGLVTGVGDFRQQKGAGDHGLWQLVEADHPEFLDVLREGRAVQDEALKDPECHDEGTQTLFDWAVEEIERRGRSTEKKAPKKGKEE